MFDKVFVSISPLKKFCFIRYRILGWQFSSFSTLNMLFYCEVSYWSKRCSLIHAFVSSCCQEFSFVCGYQQFGKNISRCWFICIFPSWDLLSYLDLYIKTAIRFQKVLATIFSYIFLPLSLPLVLLNSVLMVWYYYTCLLGLQLSFLFRLSIFICLPSSSWILSMAMPNLLLSLYN